MNLQLLALVFSFMWAYGNSAVLSTNVSRAVKLDRLEGYRVEAKNVWDQCAKTYNVTNAERQRLINLQYDNPTEGMIIIVNCYLETVGVMKMGVLQQIRAWQLYSYLFDELKISHVLSKCSNAGGYGPYDKSFRFYVCFELERHAVDA